MLYRLVEHYDTNNFETSSLVLNDESIECFICLQERSYNEHIIKMNNQTLYLKTCDCDGYIHTNCLSKWYKMNTSCPICRRNMIRFSNENIQNLFKNHKIVGFIYFNIYDPLLKIVCSEISIKIMGFLSRLVFYMSFLIIWYSIVTFYYMILLYLR